jgi:hypothetical protein
MGAYYFGALVDIGHYTLVPYDFTKTVRCAYFPLVRHCSGASVPQAATAGV